MATVREAKYAFREFQRNIHVNSILLEVRTFQQFGSVQKPYKLAIEPKVHGKQSPIQCQKHIFALAVHSLDRTISGQVGQARCFLRLHGDGMKDVDTANTLTLHEGAQCAYHSFDFRQFGHRRAGDQEPGSRMSVCFFALASAAALKRARIGFPSYQ